MSYKPHWKRGQWKAICDVCGKMFHSGQLRQRWDGFIVCKDDYESRHPMDFLRGVKEEIGTEWARKEPTDVFNGPVYPTILPTPAPTTIPATDQSSWQNPFNPNYSGPAWVPATGSPPAPAPVNMEPTASWNSPYIYLGQGMDPIFMSDPNAGDSVTVALTSGSLPPGITLNANGTFTGTALSEGSYAFTITPTDNHGLAGASMSALVNVIRQFPAGEEPTNLRITNITTTGCIPTWNDNTSYETYYQLRRQRFGTSTWEDVGIVDNSPYGTFVPANSTAYADTYPISTAGTIYTYQVRAVRVGTGPRYEYSAWSNTASVTVPAAAPAPAPTPTPISTQYVYEYYQSSSLAGLSFRYGTSSTAPVGWTTQGIAFIAPASTESSVVPVYEFYSSTTEGTKYLYDQLGSPATSGWTQGGIAFYAYPSGSVTDTVSVFAHTKGTTSGSFNYYTVDNSRLPSGYSGSYSRYYAFAPATAITIPSTGSSSTVTIPVSYTARTNTRWIDPVNGVDGNVLYDGTTKAKAWKTLRENVTSVPADCAVIYVDGVYTADYSLLDTYSRDQIAQNVTIRSETLWGAVITGIGQGNAFTLQDTKNLEVYGLHLKNWADSSGNGTFTVMGDCDGLKFIGNRLENCGNTSPSDREDHSFYIASGATYATAPRNGQIKYNYITRNVGTNIGCGLLHSYATTGYGMHDWDISWNSVYGDFNCGVLLTGLYPDAGNTTPPNLSIHDNDIRISSAYAIGVIDWYDSAAGTKGGVNYSCLVYNNTCVVLDGASPYGDGPVWNVRTLSPAHAPYTQYNTLYQQSGATALIGSAALNMGGGVGDVLATSMPATQTFPPFNGVSPHTAPTIGTVTTAGAFAFHTRVTNSDSSSGTQLFLPLSAASSQGGLPTTLPAGSLVIVGMEWQGGTATATVTNTSETWNYTTVQNTGTLYSRVGWTYNTSAVSSGWNPCFNLSTARTDRVCAILVYTMTYPANNPYVDVKYYSNASASSPNTNAITIPVNAGLLVSVTAHSDGGKTLSPGAGYTERGEKDQIQVQDQIVTTSGSYDSFAVLSAADAAIMTTLAFKDATSTTGVVPAPAPAPAPAPVPAPGLSGVPVYEYYKTGSVIGLKFRYGTSSTAPSGYTTQGIAFYGANSTDAGAVAIHEWSAGPDSDGDLRYAYDSVDTGGWTDTTNVAFYAFSANATGRIGVYACLASTSSGAFSFYTITSGTLPTGYSAGSYLRYYVYDNGTSLALPTASSGGGSGSSTEAATPDSRVVCWHTPGYPWDSTINYGIHDGKIRADDYYHMAELPSIGGSGPYGMTASSNGLKLGTNGERVWRFESEAAATTYLNNLNTATSGALGSSRSTPSGSNGGVYYFRLQPPLHFTDGTTRADFNFWGNTIWAGQPYAMASSIEILNGITTSFGAGIADFWDIHWSDNGARYRQQPIEMSINKSGSSYYVNFRLTYYEPNLSASLPAGWARVSDQPYQAWTNIYQLPVSAAHRYYLYIRFNISNNASGYFQLYVRDQATGTTTQVVDYSGRLGDNTNDSGQTFAFFPKLGLYQWWNPSDSIDILSDGQIIFNDVAGSYSLTPDAVINALIAG